MPSCSQAEGDTFSDAASRALPEGSGDDERRSESGVSSCPIEGGVEGGCAPRATSDASPESEHGAEMGPSRVDGGTNPIEASTSCATGFTDLFAGPSVDPCWMALNGTPAAPLVDVAISGGALHLRSIVGAPGLWFNDGTGALIYKLLTASDFVVTTMVHPRKRSNGSLGPSQPPYHGLGVGGIMARAPSSAGESYLFIMMGSNEDDPPTQSLEVKTTTAGITTAFTFPAWSHADAELRMCRIGSNFLLLARIPPALPTWALIETYARPDLPASLEVGAGVNFNPDNDLDVAFDDIVLAPSVPLTAGDCIGE
jgi:hypothetical protein